MQGCQGRQDRSGRGWARRTQPHRPPGRGGCADPWARLSANPANPSTSVSVSTSGEVRCASR